MNYKLYAVRIFVRDWKSAVRFYEEKLSMVCEFKDENLGWAQFKVGGSDLGIERVEPDDDRAELVGRFVGVSLQVEDLEGVYEELMERGVKFTMPPTHQDWGGSLAHFEDPEGNVLSLLG